MLDRINLISSKIENKVEEGEFVVRFRINESTEQCLDPNKPAENWQETVSPAGQQQHKEYNLEDPQNPADNHQHRY